MKKRALLSLVLILALLAALYLWYTRPISLRQALPQLDWNQITACYTVLVPTNTNNAIEDVEIPLDGSGYSQLWDLLNNEKFSRQVGPVSDAQRITLEPQYAHLSFRQSETLITLTFYGPQVIAEVSSPTGSRGMALRPQGGEEFQASVVDLLASLAPGAKA